MPAILSGHGFRRNIKLRKGILLYVRVDSISTPYPAMRLRLDASTSRRNPRSFCTKPRHKQKNELLALRSMYCSFVTVASAKSGAPRRSSRWSETRLWPGRLLFNCRFSLLRKVDQWGVRFAGAKRDSGPDACFLIVAFRSCEKSIIWTLAFRKNGTPIPPQLSVQSAQCGDGIRKQVVQQVQFVTCL